ncbi:hypothetical protein M3Y99_00964800 [Aphelenchoides fujianensis]|nr:hypothetical protein M3Y99_00964800 [Aphelenchoides fujianensis]
MVAMDRKKKVLTILWIIFGIWHFGTHWTTTLLSFLQWDTVEAFGSLCNALGALLIGQLTDSIGPKIMFIFSTVLTSFYYIGLGICRHWYSFFFLQVLRFGYQLDSTAEMYLATATTERERTGALLLLGLPQALSMFLAPLAASRIAIWTSLRTSQVINGIVMPIALIPVIFFLLPTTHSVPRIASARLRPQDYWPMITRNPALREGITLRALLITSYVCYEIIARNFLLRAFMKGTTDSAEVLITMGAALLAVQFVVLPFLQKRCDPKKLLQLSVIALTASYVAVNFITSLNQFLVITAIQTGAYAISYAESSTLITSSVETSDLGKATGLASMAQWTVNFIVPIYTSHLVNHWHYTYAFYTSAILSVLTFGYITLFAKQTNARTYTVLPSMVVT